MACVGEHLIFSYFLGSGNTGTNKPITITSAKILIKGIWHKIILGIYGRKVYLSVDNVVNSGLLLIESGLNLSGEHIYLGKSLLQNRFHQVSR